MTAEKVFPDNVDGFFFQKAWAIFWENREFFIKFVFVIAVIFFIIDNIYIFFISSHFNIPSTEKILQDIQYLGPLIIDRLIYLIIIKIPESFFILVLIKILPRLYEGEHVIFSQVFSVRLSQWILLYICIIIVLLLQIVGFMMCFLPGILVSIQFAFFAYVIVLEENTQVIPRSFQIVSGKQWNVFMLYLLYFFSYIFLLVANMFFAFVTGSGTEVQENMISTSSMLVSFFNELFESFIKYFMIVLFFQLYMMSRIEKGEIEVELQKST